AEVLRGSVLQDDWELTLEDLSIAFHAAENAGLHPLADELHGRLQQRFANHGIARELEFVRLTHSRRCDEAAGVGKSIDNTLWIAQAEAFASKTLRADRYLAEAAKVGERESALLECAHEALRRNFWCNAILWCREVTPDHALFFSAFKLRVQTLSRALTRHQKGFYIVEFKALCEIAALRPTQREYREHLVWLIEHGMEEPLAHGLFGTLLLLLPMERSQHDADSIALSKAIHETLRQKRQPLDEARLESALGRYLTDVKERRAIGDGCLRPDILADLGPEAIPVVCGMLKEPDAAGELAVAKGLLHLLALLCKAHGDPSSDFVSLQPLLAGQSVLGAAQEARNLGETALAVWAENQPAHRTWRTAQAWAAYAEAFLRAGNVLAAALWTCFAYVSHPGPALHAEALASLYRLSARILRDLHLAPVAVSVAVLERRFIERWEDNQIALHRNEVFVFEMANRQVIQSGFEEKMLAALREADRLLAIGVESERSPLLSAEANLLRHLPPGLVPPEIVANFHEARKSLPDRVSRLLAGTAKPEVDRDDLLEAFQALAPASFVEDLRFQIAPILPLVCTALKTACSRGDADLFLLASAPLAQPALRVGHRARADGGSLD